MINQKSIEAVGASKFSTSFRKPLYDSYCFSNIPGTLERALTGTTTLATLPADTLINAEKQYDTVLLFFIDAFGWRFFERYKDNYPTLQRFITDGKVSKITSQFPSTTSAHVTTIHTGKRVDESGVFEWFYYEPLVDDMISPLPYAVAGEEAGSLRQHNIEPATLYPESNIFEGYSKKDVETHIFQSAEFTPSTYGDVVTKGVTVTHPFHDLSQALLEIGSLLQKSDGIKRYIYCYFGDIDAAGHEFGTNSLEFNTAVKFYFNHLETYLFEQLSSSTCKSLIAMTADHGQTDIDPATTIYINQIIPEMDIWVKRNKDGKAMMPGGSPRDLFVYVKDEYLEIAFQTLTTKLTGIAEVYRTETLIEAGLFGDKPSQLLCSRLSNICILPFTNDSVYWYEAGKFEQEFYGHHGGLTPEEMESVFMVLEL